MMDSKVRSNGKAEGGREAEQTNKLTEKGGRRVSYAPKHMRSEHTHTHTVLLSLGNDEEAKRLCNATFIMTK